LEPKRWARVDEILQKALDLPPEEQDSFLRTACAGDPALEQDVRSLLASDEKASGFLEIPTLQMDRPGAGLGAADVEEDLSGQQFSHYRMVEKLGFGGMGVVYRAEDERLRRSVAVKVISKLFLRDPSASSRFLREARAASAVNHPNLCTVYDVGEANGRSFLVMELLEGETIQKQIDTRGPLPFPEVISLALEILEGLDAAHKAGIVHRDIKPANLFITKEGRAKILDLGLAQLEGEEPLSHTGIVAGTAQYMSPEQGRGEKLDPRSDLYSFGLTLHEMATGELPQAGQWSKKLPAALKPILSKCLQNERDLRYPRASDLSAELAQAARPSGNRQRRLIWGAVALVALVAALAAGIYFSRSRTVENAPSHAIVLADFVNKTGEPVFDETLRQALALQLARSPHLNVVDDSRIQRTLSLMGKPDGTPLTLETALQICERTESSAVLQGTITRLGTEYVLTLLAKRCDSGEVLFGEQQQVARKEAIIPSLSQIAERFRVKAGETEATIRKYPLTDLEAATPSLEAWRAYASALKSPFAPVGLEFAKRAVELDPEFAMGHALLGRAYADRWETELAEKSFSRAYELRDRVKERERFFITANYQIVVTRNLYDAERTCEAWATAYPRDLDAHALYAGILQWLGQYEKSAVEGREVLRWNPDFLPGYINSAWAYVLLGRFDEASQILDAAERRKLEGGEPLIIRFAIAFLKHDDDGMQRTAAIADKNPEVADWIAHTVSTAHAFSGRLAESRVSSKLAVERALQRKFAERAAMFEVAAGVREAFLGSGAEARRRAAAGLALSHSRDVESGAALAFALAGDFSRSNSLGEQLEKRYPEDTIIQTTVLPLLNALAALDGKRPDQALEKLATAASLEQAVPGTFFAFFGFGYPMYFRGVADLAKGDANAAVSQFQKMLGQPGLLLTDPAGALARWQLARAYAAAGDRAKAKSTYEDILAIWKNADPDFVPAQQAKAEYRKLQ
jgi:tetratricopeptide (TPR) repeat protein